MAQQQIIWSHIAKIRLYAILEFYATRNGNRTYSAKLYRKFQRELKLVGKHPSIGTETDVEEVRGLIVGDYVLFYEKHDLGIMVHTVWDCRQNPDKLKIK